MILLAMMLAQAAASPPALAFDLSCNGTKSVESWKGRERTKISDEPVGLLLRVDLSRKLWCEGDCKAPAPIASVDDSIILFQKKDGSGGDDLTMLNRRTGEFLDRDRIYVTPTDTDIVVTRTSGSCQPSAFSGFPAAKL